MKDGVTWVTWTFSRPVEKATLKLEGSAEIYGVSTDGTAGVAVDNIPMRGSTGHILTRIDKDLMKAAFELDGTRLVILQFGGNFVPAAGSSKAISGYMDKVREQIAYYRDAAPDAKILFIGPSDMAASTEDGRIVSYRRLPELVDSLKAVSLASGAAYWDLYRMMGGQNSMAQWVRHSPAYAGPDYVHFTPAGAKVVGESSPPPSFPPAPRTPTAAGFRRCGTPASNGTPSSSRAAPRPISTPSCGSWTPSSSPDAGTSASCTSAGPTSRAAPGRTPSART